MNSVASRLPPDSEFPEPLKNVDPEWYEHILRAVPSTGEEAKKQGDRDRPASAYPSNDLVSSGRAPFLKNLGSV